MVTSQPNSRELRPQAFRRTAVMLLMAVVCFLCMEGRILNLVIADTASSFELGLAPPPLETTRGANSGKLKIAMISGFVTNEPGPQAPRINEVLMDHMVNKACYCDLHGYDYIFNTTWGFSKEEHKPWLDYGTWHRVPHMQAVLPHYDWIVYADTDWIVQDMTLPLESFLKDFELHGKRSVSVFLPVDVNGITVFSAFVVMIRNNAFGRRLLENWMTFARGEVCPNGNFPIVPGKYQWGDSDQPGIWWSLAKTHSEFTGNELLESKCNETTGLIETDRYFGPNMREYFKRVGGIEVGGAGLGSQGEELDKIPDDQPIIWTQVSENSRSGIGYQATFGDFYDVDWPHAFAMHTKLALRDRIQKNVDHCRSERGCYAFYTDDGEFHVGCNNTFASLGQD